MSNELARACRNDDAAFLKLVAKKQAERRDVAAEPGQGTQAPVPEDGRLSSSVDARGLVQLNVRVPMEVKAAVITERLRRKSLGLDASDVSDIVTEALLTFLSQQPRDA